jgi:hypothetical protein
MNQSFEETETHLPSEFLLSCQDETVFFLEPVGLTEADLAQLTYYEDLNVFNQ